jgi:predicted nucleic acid-binding protein
VIVLDASAFIEATLGSPEVADRLAGEDIHAPHLIDLEVAGALRRLVAEGRVDAGQAETGLAALGQAQIHRHPHTPLLPSIWAMRNTVTPYDAAYVVLAAALGAPLVTTDHKLAAVPGLPCAVEVL